MGCFNNRFSPSRPTPTRHQHARRVHLAVPEGGHKGEFSSKKKKGVVDNAVLTLL